MASLDQVAESLRVQIGFCRALGSELTARLLEAVAADLADGGRVAQLVSGFTGNPREAVLPLRIAGGLRRYALDHPDSALTAFFPGGGEHGTMSQGRLREALEQALAAAPELLERYLQLPPQTNEVGRSAVLITGYLRVGAIFGLPLDVREIGASAGLNLCFDRFHYRFGDHSWGDPESPVRLAPTWRGPLPDLEARLEVRSRAGCDLHPIDVRDLESVRRLEAYVWADQPARLERLRAAITIARQLDVRVERASADRWLERQLAGRPAGVATVVAHSIMWTYLSGDQQARVSSIIRAAGERAQDERPLAWLAMEQSAGLDQPPVLSLTLWPGGETRELAVAHPHGESVKWLGADDRGQPPR